MEKTQKARKGVKAGSGGTEPAGRWHWLKSAEGEASPTVLGKSAIALAIALIAANLAMIFIAVMSYRVFFAQAGARMFVGGTVGVLVVYAIALAWIGRRRAASWEEILRNAGWYGLGGGLLDIVNIAMENGVPVALPIPTLTIGVMVTLFLSWGAAGFRTTRVLGSIRAGVVAAVLSAGMCMLMAVAGGFAIEFFLHPPDPAYVATWAEFKRSGWSDARAFGLANTLDSALTHLVVAPAVALVVGSCASLLAVVGAGKRGSAASV